MPDTEPATYERDLTPAEAEERKALCLDLLTEKDQHLADIDQFRSQIRKLNAKLKKLDLRTAQIRHEIRSGKVLEPRQVKINFGVELGEASPFEKRYPLARDHERLHTDLSVVLQGVLVPSIEKLSKWPVQSGIFYAVASWTRVELAYLNAKENADIDLPVRTTMPVKLAELRAELQRVTAEHSRKRPRRSKASAGERGKKPRAAGGRK